MLDTHKKQQYAWLVYQKFHILDFCSSLASRQAKMSAVPLKRSKSAYSLFFAEKREEIFAMLSNEGVEKAKLVAASSKRAGNMWKALGEAKQKPYYEKAAKLMDAYTQEMEAFKTVKPDFKKLTKAKKGEDKLPVRPAGAYGMWMADNRTMLMELVMKNHSVDKSKAFVMLYHEGKPIYEALPPAEKKMFLEKAEAAKAKFQAEFKIWKEKHKENKKGGSSDVPKRPLGAYAQWIADNRPMLTEKVMAKHGVDKSKAFLMLYKEGRPFYDALPAEDRKKCEGLAEAAKVKFQAANKNWKEKNKRAKVTKDEDKNGKEHMNAEDAEGEEETTQEW